MATNNSNIEILILLQSKNRCLERLLDATSLFLSCPLESLILTDGSADLAPPLAKYEAERNSVIKTLELHDRTINSLTAALTAEEKTPSFLNQVRNELLQNEKLITSVVNADEIVFKRIQDAQTQIAKLVNETRKTGDMLSKFKSASTTTGEGMDKTL